MRRLAWLALLAAGVAHADPDPPEVGRTVVTGLRLPRPVRDTPATVTVIPRDEIARSPELVVDDLIRTAPSVATFRRSSSLIADPTSQGLDLRGLGPSGVSRALVLRDGLPLNDPFGGWVYWRAIPLIDLERVEIAPGGASASFGNFALGGALQLISRPIRGPAIDLAVAAGSLATRRAALLATERLGSVGLALDVDALDSDGYAPIAPAQRGAVDGPAPSHHVAVGGRAEWQRGDELVRANARLFDESLDAGTRLTTADVRTAQYGASWVHDRFDLGAYGSDQVLDQQRARVSADRDAAALASQQHAPSHGQGASLRWTSPSFAGLGRHTLLIGADATRVIGRAEDTVLPASGAMFERIAGGEQRFAGLYVEDAASLGDRVEAALALRGDVWRDQDGQQTVVRGGDPMRTDVAARTETQLSPRLGVLVRATPVVALRASASRAFRAPTLNELYRPFQVGTVATDANPALVAETSLGGELGAEVVVGELVARATGFWSRLDDPIQNVTLAGPSPSGATRQRQNLGRARVRGAELEASWRPAARWIATAAYTFVDAVVTSAPGHDDLRGKRLAQDPRDRASASLAFDDRARGTVTAQVRWLGRQFEDDLNTLPMAGALVVDALAARPIHRRLAVFVSVDNLLDRRYLVGRAGVDTVGAPRTVMVGVRLAAR